MVDMAHFAGLVAGGVFPGDFNPSPTPTSSPPPRTRPCAARAAAWCFAPKEFAEHVDKGCPLVLGGPLPHVMAAKAVAFTEANRPEFKTYAHKIVENARAWPRPA